MEWQNSDAILRRKVDVYVLRNKISSKFLINNDKARQIRMSYTMQAFHEVRC